MGRRLILDSVVLIDVERGRRSLLDVVADDDDIALAAVTIAELWEGVERADEHHRANRLLFVDDLMDSVIVEDYTAETAIAHGRLLACARRLGRPRGAHDLIIAATAVMTKRAIVTYDTKARFGDLPGVEVVDVPRA